MGLGRMQQTASDDEDNPKGATVAGAEEQKKMCKCRSWCLCLDIKFSVWTW